MTDATQTPNDRSLALTCLLLRLGAGYFLLVWGINKFLTANQSVRLYDYFYGLKIPDWAPLAMGAGETLVASMILFGIWRPVSYGIGFLIHATTVGMLLPRILTPFSIVDGFPENRTYAAAVAALAAFAALFLLRRYDRWSVDAWWRARTG